MLLKAFLIVISLIFLFGGGLCSFFLLFTAAFAIKILGLIMVAIALWATIEVIRWNPNSEESVKSRNRVLSLVFISVVFVIALYVLSMSGLINIRWAG
jgi:archaellum biogenesis protein FlaJ (TadC family)